MKAKNIFAVTILFTICVTILLPQNIFSAAATEKPNEAWQISVTGLVSNPLNVTLTELKAMPQTTVQAHLVCVDQPEVSLSIGNWTGVQLSYILGQAGVLPQAIKVAFFASDGYSTDLTIQQATDSDTILAYQRDGQPLPEVIRLVVPGYWGYKWIFGITKIELVDFDFLGHWEIRGYSDQALITSGTGYPPSFMFQLNFSNPENTPTITPSPSPSTPTPTLQPTPILTATPTPTSSILPTPSATTLPEITSTPTPSPTATEAMQPDASNKDSPTSSILPLAVAAVVIIAVVVVVVAVTVYRKKDTSTD